MRQGNDHRREAAQTRGLALLCLAATVTAAAAELVHCDIAVAGGSAASLAAAVTAAEADPSLRVCLTDWTDWPGGQMTSGGVPAIDFGSFNARPENQPASFRSAMASIPGSGNQWNPNSNTGSGSPGACSVSTKCFLPNVFVATWVMPRLQRLPNLRVQARGIGHEVQHSFNIPR